MNQILIRTTEDKITGKSNTASSYKLTENIIIPLTEDDINQPHGITSLIIHRLGEEIDKLNARINEL